MEHVGIRLPDINSGYSVQEVVDTAVLAEEAGYHSVWVAEGHGRNAFMLLSQVAQATSRISLGVGIANVFSRSPSLIAMSTATLDDMAPGRVILGLGASSQQLIEHWHGLEYDRPLRRIRETIDIIRTALADKRVTYHGDLFSLDHPRDFNTPTDPIPIYNAALQSRNRQLTAKFADGWMPTKLPLETLAAQIPELRNWAEDAGREPTDVTIAPFILTCVSHDATAATNAIKQNLAFTLGAMEYYANQFRSLGFKAEVKQIQSAWKTDTTTAWEHVPQEIVDEIAVTGNPSTGRERIQAYFDTGIDLAILRPPDTTTPAFFRETIRELAPTTTQNK